MEDGRMLWHNKQ